MMADRTYTEEEVAALLERAVALQGQAAHHSEHQTGLTLAELEKIAAESGLDPAFLRQAAAEFDEPEAPGATAVDAGPSATHIFAERWVPGPLTEEAQEDLLSELRHRYDSETARMWGRYSKAWGMPTYGVGQVEQSGPKLEWTHVSMSGVETRVIVSPRGEGSRLRLSQRVGWGSSIAEASTYGAGLALIACLVAAAVTKSGLLMVLAFVVALAAFIPMIYALDQGWRQKMQRRLDALADRLATLAQTDSVSSAPSSVAAPEAAPLIDAVRLDEEEAAPEATPASAAVPRRQTRT